MKKVYALKGRSNIGKSLTLKTVHEMLYTKYPELKVEHEHTTRVDVRVVLTINGSKIGIESQGDPGGRLITGSLDLFVRVGCDVIICATRTSGRTVNAVNALAGYEVVWLEQSPQSEPIEWILSNLAMARKIVEETQSVIDSAKPAVLTRAAGR